MKVLAWWHLQVGMNYDPVPNDDDVRLIARNEGYKMDWTHEEIEEFIGHWSYEVKGLSNTWHLREMTLEHAARLRL